MKIILISFFLSTIVFANQWAAHEVSLRTQIEKIREKENKLGEVIQLKKEEKDEAKFKQLLEEIKKEYKELEKLYKDLEEEKRHVRFEHPDQGVEVERKYHAYKIRSIEDMENEVGTDGRLSRLKSKVIRKYGEPVPEEKEMKEPPVKPQEQPPGKERPKLSY